MKILVANDGSKPAMHAVKYAAKLLRSLSSTSNSITLISAHYDVGLRLIALGATGRGAVADLLLGPVAQRVLTMADMPVVLVK